ncbi:MAG: HRDC domain-containing protein, partial [Arcicella sp.]|nr:HRDC domain-containing protein [Arcicella sp.]
TNEKIAMTMLIDILRGSNNKRIIDNRYHEIKTFGAGKDLKADEWAEYLQQMLNSGVMDIAYDEGHAYRLNNASWAVLKEGRKVNLTRYKPFEERQADREAVAPKEKTKKEVIKDALFEKLRELRKRLADDKNIPPFVIFSDATLSDMSQQKPISQEAMLNVSGVGQQKYQQYGEIFINEIRLFLKSVSGTNTASLGINTVQYTYKLYQEGNSVEEMAKIRGLSEVTIFSHLSKLYEEGKNIDFSPFINKQQYNEIVSAAKIMNVKKGESIKILYEAMDSKHDYSVIRIALTIWFKGGM